MRNKHQPFFELSLIVMRIVLFTSLTKEGCGGNTMTGHKNLF